jgi:uncharacterized protein YjgD (DUF1641 family)
MDNKALTERVDAMDRKLDAIMSIVQQQRQSSIVVEDLISDLSIVGKDVYDTAVEELDKRKVEIEPAELTELGIAFLKNLKNFNQLMNTMESVMDLLDDLSPILNEVLIDVTRKFGELDQKGYFEFLNESAQIVDNIVTGFSKEDVKALADNIVLILSTMKDLTQPKMLKSMDNAVKVFANIETNDIPEVSVWKLMRSMNKPEIKKGIGFLLTFMSNLSENIEQQTK